MGYPRTPFSPKTTPPQHRTSVGQLENDVFVQGWQSHPYQEHPR